MKRFLPCFFVGVLLSVLSCKDDDVIGVNQAENEIITEYLDSLGLLASSVQDASGLYSYPIALNPSGRSQSSGRVLFIHYSLQVLGGQVIDVLDSLDGDTLVVKQGANAIYPVGLDNALAYMKEGETWGFVLPSSIAYGAYSYSSLIPENAIILAEISLLEIQSEDDVLDAEIEAISNYVSVADLRDTVRNPLNMPENMSNGMVYKRLIAGSGGRPESDQPIVITYEGRDLEGNVFDRAAAGGAFEYAYNTGEVIPGLDVGVGKMELGERALLIIPSYLAYRESAQVIPDFLTADMVELDIVPAYADKVEPYETLVFEVQLIEMN